MASNKDPDSHHCIVSVLGYMAHGKVFKNSTAGTGKSCLCCRFTHPAVDDYIDDHPSLMALHEFESSVVCTDSFLYWGSKELEYPSTKGKMPKVTVDVVEHTIFYHDETSKAFPKLASLHDIDKYTKQAIALPNSSRKISYYARDCIGFPDQYSCVPYPNNVSKILRGFVIVCDVSVKLRQFNAHLTATEQIAHRLFKDSKMPFIVAATKRDSADPESLQKLYEWAYKKKITVIETSAKENVNVKLVFSHIATKILKGAKLSSTLVSYSDAIGISLMESTRTKQKFRQFLKNKVRSSNFMLSSIEESEDYVETVEILGKFGADEIYARHLLEIRDTEVRSYPGVLENPDMRMEMLEQFVDDISLELIAHKRTLKSMINTLVSPNDNAYINRHSPSTTESMDTQQSTDHGPLPDIPNEDLYEDIDSLPGTPSIALKSAKSTEVVDEYDSFNDLKPGTIGSTNNSAKPSPATMKRSSPEFLKKPFIPSNPSSPSISPALLRREPVTTTPTTSVSNELQIKLKEGQANLTRRGPPPSYHSLQHPKPEVPRADKVEMNVTTTQIVNASPISSPRLKSRGQDHEQSHVDGNSADVSDRYGVLKPASMAETDINNKEKSTLYPTKVPLPALPPPTMPRPPRDSLIFNTQQQQDGGHEDQPHLPPLPNKNLPPLPPYNPLLPSKLVKKDDSKPSENETGTQPKPAHQETTLPSKAALNQFKRPPLPLPHEPSSQLPPELLSHLSERPPFPLPLKTSSQLPPEPSSHQFERPPFPLPPESKPQLPVQSGPRESSKPDIPNKAPTTKPKPLPANKPTKPLSSAQAGSTPPVKMRNSIIAELPHSVINTEEAVDRDGMDDDDIYVSSSADVDDILKPIPPVPSVESLTPSKMQPPESQANKGKQQSGNAAIYQNKGPLRKASPPSRNGSPPPLRTKPKKQTSNESVTSDSKDQSTKPSIAPPTKPHRSKTVVTKDNTEAPPIPSTTTKPHGETKSEKPVATKIVPDPTKLLPTAQPTKSMYSETTPISKTNAATKKPEVVEYKPRLDALRKRVEKEKQDKQSSVPPPSYPAPPPSYPAPSEPLPSSKDSPSTSHHSPRPSLPPPTDHPSLPTTSLPHSRSMESSDGSWAPGTSSHTPHNSKTKTLPHPSKKGNLGTPGQPGLPPPLPPRTPDMQDYPTQFDYSSQMKTNNTDQRQRSRTTIGVPTLSPPVLPQPAPSPGSSSPGSHSPQRRSTKRKDYFDMVKKRFFTRPSRDESEEIRQPTQQPQVIPVRKPQFINMVKRPLPLPPEESLEETFADVPIDPGIDYEPVDVWGSSHRPPPPLPVQDPPPQQHPQAALPVPPELIPANTEELLQDPQKMEEFVRRLLLQMNANRKSLTEPSTVSSTPQQSLSPRKLPQRSKTFNHPQHQTNQDDEGYEITDDWSVPIPSTELEYHYPEIRGCMGNRQVHPSRGGSTSPKKQFKPRAPTPPLNDDDYVNMGEDGDEEFDYENAEAIRKLRTGRSLDDTSLPSRKLVPRRNSLDDSSLYYNLHSRDFLSSNTVPPRGSDDGDMTKGMMKQGGPVNSRVDHETGQSQSEISESIPIKRKPRPLPPRNLPRPGGSATTSLDNS